MRADPSVYVLNPLRNVYPEPNVDLLRLGGAFPGNRITTSFPTLSRCIICHTLILEMAHVKMDLDPA